MCVHKIQGLDTEIGRDITDIIPFNIMCLEHARICLIPPQCTSIQSMELEVGT